MDDLDKIYERIIEMQNNIETSDAKQHGLMLNELVEMVSKIEQSLAEVKNDISKIETQQNEE